MIPLRALTFGAFLGLIPIAQAAPIAGPFNAGAEDSTTALAAGIGIADPHSSIRDASDPALIGRSPITDSHPSYPPDDANSRWLSNGSDALVPEPADDGGVRPMMSAPMGAAGDAVERLSAGAYREPCAVDLRRT